MNNAAELKTRVLNKLSEFKLKQEARKNCENLISEEEQNLSNILEKRRIHEEASSTLLQYLELGKLKSKCVFEEIATSAIQGIFGKEARVEIEYSEKRNNSSAELKIALPLNIGKGNILIPLENDGGGLNDVICFAFVVSLLELTNPKLQGPLMADETFKHLDEWRMQECGEMIRTTLNPDNNGAEGDGRQLIFTTHKKKLLPYADRVFKFELSDLITSYKEVTDEILENEE
jgi:hypothetical protein